MNDARDLTDLLKGLLEHLQEQEESDHVAGILQKTADDADADEAEIADKAHRRKDKARQPLRFPVGFHHDFIDAFKSRGHIFFFVKEFDDFKTRKVFFGDRV